MAVTKINFGNGDNSAPLQELEQNKYSFDAFSYPLDLFRNPELNHYVCFYINETNNTNFKSLSQTSSQGTVATNPEGKTSQNPNGSSSQSTSDIPTINQDSRQVGANGAANNNQAITRTNTSIALYMPNLMTTDVNNWSQEALGWAGSITGKEISDIGSAYGRKDWDDFAQKLETAGKNVGGDIFSAMGRRLLQASSWITDANILGAIGANNREAYNSHLEVLYQGPSFRTFNFSFIMSPRSAQEAQAVANIIRAFRFYGAPELTQQKQGLGRYFVYPSEFDIKFFSNGKPNSFLNKISTCALTNIQTDYTGGKGWSAFRPDQAGNLNTNGVPIQTTLTLTFMELEVITKLRVLQGF